MLEPYRDRVVVAELDTNKAVEDDVDIALYDSFAQPESDQEEVKMLIDNPHATPGRRLHLELPSRARRRWPGTWACTATCPRR